MSKEQAIKLYLEGGLRKDAVATELGVSRSQAREWLRGVNKRYDTESVVEEHKPSSEALLKDRIRQLEQQAAAQHRETLDEHYVKSKIVGLTELTPQPPHWLVEGHSYGNWSAVPTLFASDWHWGEVIDPSQIGGVNSYDLEEANHRAQTMVEKSITLLDMVGGEYPGIVFALGGDLMSGNIHQELANTNDAEIMPTFLNLYERLIWCISTLADKYDRVFVPVVTGNHSRTTHKIQHKERTFTNYDWLMGCLLAKYFENDDRIEFQIPNGPDALFSIYGTRYLLTHGDSFRGGDGLIGFLGPLTRGDHKKRSRNNQIDMGYDVMVVGHFHQLHQSQRLIANGSLCGYNEFAYNNNFGYEVPRQALWLTHRDHGIIMSMAVNVSEPEEHVGQDWVSWKE